MELADAHVSLIPLRDAPFDALHAAAGTIERWTLSLAPFGASREELARYVARIVADEDAGRSIAFAVRDATTGRVLGSTGFKQVDRENRKAELGYTWYVPEVWGTVVNPACKLLLLEHAFGRLELERVSLHVDAENVRSLRAVAKLGAVREGFLRHELRASDGTWRDTVVFSILAGEWPGVRDALLARLR